MAAHRDKPHARSGLRVDGNADNRSRTGLAEAVKGLRRLTQDPRFANIERVLAIPDNALRGSDVSVETLRALRNWGAEHLRVADELEAAARCCRLPADYALRSTGASAAAVCHRTVSYGASRVGKIEFGSANSAIVR